jgi:hypothetical protein
MMAEPDSSRIPFFGEPGKQHAYGGRVTPGSRSVKASNNGSNPLAGYSLVGLRGLFPISSNELFQSGLSEEVAVTETLVMSISRVTSLVRSLDVHPWSQVCIGRLDQWKPNRGFRRPHSATFGESGSRSCKPVSGINAGAVSDKFKSGTPRFNPVAKIEKPGSDPLHRHRLKGLKIIHR